ncbi:Solute carrier family 25 member 40 [Lamellibrachia satsuma]|nr:Solute carrier family 25 member 40 [Lamellibrachia satsuma]
MFNHWVVPWNCRCCSFPGNMVGSTNPVAQLTLPSATATAQCPGGAQERPIRPGTYFYHNNGLMDSVCVCKTCARNGGATPWYQKQGRFNSTMDALVKIARQEGIRTLWSGLPPTLVMAVPATMIYFTGYDHLKDALGYSESDPSTRYIPVVAGVLARIGAATATSPLELIRTKMQSERLTYKRLTEIMLASISGSGIKSLFMGLGSTLFRDVPFSGIYWFGYEYIKSKRMKARGETKPRFRDSFVAGALSGAFAAVVTLPFDVVKTHKQIALGETELNKSKPQPAVSTFRALTQVYRKQGISALFSGVVPRVAKVAPACAIMISTFEYSKVAFSSYNESRRSTM